MSGDGSGCYYNNDYQPAVYSKYKQLDIVVTVRYYMDSFISADEMTEGCSSATISSSSCFGLSRSEQNMTATIIVLIGIGLLALEVGLFVFSCLCCRDTVKSTLNHKKKNGLLDNEDRPNSSEPSYVPTAQAAYDPSQPSYVPATQPSYVPGTLNVYVSAHQTQNTPQPVYASAQQTQNTPQPVYIPAQQTQNTPQQTYNTPAAQPAYNAPYQVSYMPNYNSSNY